MSIIYMCNLFIIHCNNLFIVLFWKAIQNLIFDKLKWRMQMGMSPIPCGSVTNKKVLEPEILCLKAVRVEFWC